MAYYESTFACGHDGRVNIIGPSKDRIWKRERAFSGLCPECYKKKTEEDRKRANIEAAEKSSELELPILTGTEKQVAWANTLRLNVIERYESLFEEFEKKIEQAKAYLEKSEREGKPSEYTLSDLKLYAHGKNGEKIPTSIEELSDAMDYILTSKTNASFWIDNRYLNDKFGYLIEEYREYKAKNDIPNEVREEIADQKEQLTVIPDIGERKSGIVELAYNEENSVLSAKYIKDEGFIEIVKGLNYKWDGTWYKRITEYTGTVADRAAELGNKLLLAGYTVQFPSEESKNAAISGKYVSENDRWIKWHTTENRFAIIWKARNDTLYGAAKKLPGARWKDGSMTVSIDFYHEVLDFAETMGFSISQKAKEEIEKYKEKESRFECGQIGSAEQVRITDNERLERALKSGGTIITDLVDEE